METDPTEADPASPTEAGTQAESPHAMAHAVAEAVVSSGRSSASARPSAWGTSARPGPTAAAEAHDKSDIDRMRGFHRFGIVAPLGGIAMSLLLGGDRAGKIAFWIGAAILSAANVGLSYLTTSAKLYQPRPVGILWIVATTSVLPAIYYFGPFSAVVMVLMLGIVFIALGRAKWTALAIAGICIGGHVAITLPILLGWIDDVGILSSARTAPEQRWVAEALIVGFLMSGYALGRWARRTNATALAELQQAMRVIGDKEQALAEVVDEAQRQNRANEGRWTNHVMGSFKLGLVLGRGAMGEVYDAVRTDGTPAAIKLLNARSTASAALVERFHREMEVAARLESPHIVRVYELSRPDAPVPYLAMEKLAGVDLAGRLRAENRLPTDEVVNLIDQVARGLEIARLAGVVHRDLKPHNLFCHDGTTWKILDFGVSKVLDSEGTLTGDGIVGTPQYMAPEQASGGHVTHLADVYALGAIAYRCMTGRSPFKGRDLSELVYQVVHAPPIRPSALGRMSHMVEDVLAVAMAKDPRRRFPSAVSFAQAFVAARRGKPVAIEPPLTAWT